MIRATPAICGYTEADLATVFAPELPGLDRDQIRDWYNGYSWLGDEKVYNPFDILLLFDSRKFGAYWFETGTPTFLIETLCKRHVSSLELGSMEGGSALLSTFDVDDMATEALLFQTGYLTITDEEDLGGEPHYLLGYPNREVRQSLNRSLLRYLVKDPSRQMANSVRALPATEGQRLCRAGDAVPRLFRQHSLRVVCQQRHRPLRGLLRQRVLLLFRGGRAGHKGGRQQ